MPYYVWLKRKREATGNKRPLTITFKRILKVEEKIVDQ